VPSTRYSLTVHRSSSKFCLGVRTSKLMFSESLILRLLKSLHLLPVVSINPSVVRRLFTAILLGIPAGINVSSTVFICEWYYIAADLTDSRECFVESQGPEQ